MITVTGIANFGGPNAAGFVYEETTPEIADNFSYIRGSHSFKFGVSTHAIRDTQVQATFAQYNFPTIAAYLAAVNGSAPKGYSSFSQIVGNPSLNYNSLFTNFFAQDSWKPMRNLTVTYGLRYDLYQMPSADKTSPFAYSQNFRTDKNNFGPRLGFAYGLGKDQKTVIRASSRHLLRFAADRPVSPGDLVQRQSGVLHAVGDAGDEFRAVLPERVHGAARRASPGSTDITTISPDFANLYSINANFSVTPRIDGYVGADRILSLHGGQAPAGLPQHQRGAGRDLPGGRTADLRHGALLRGLRQHHVGGIGGHLHLQRPERHAAQATGARVRSLRHVHLVARHRRRAGAEQHRRGRQPAERPDQPAPRPRRFADRQAARLQHDRRADAGMSRADNKAANYLANHNRLSFAIVASSGDLFNMGSNRVLNGDSTEGAAFQRPLFVGRNTIRAGYAAEINARYSRLFPVTEKKSVEFLAETTNLGNRLNVTGLNYHGDGGRGGQHHHAGDARAEWRRAISACCNWACASTGKRSALFLLAFGFDEIELGLLRYAGLEASAAARFVHIGSAHHDQVVRPAQALRVLGGIAAAHADGQRLGDGFGMGQQVRNGRERPSQVVGIQAGDDHLLAAIGEPLRHLHQLRTHEIGLVDADHFAAPIDALRDLARRWRPPANACADRRGRRFRYRNSGCR